MDFLIIMGLVCLGAILGTLVVWLILTIFESNLKPLTATCLIVLTIFTLLPVAIGIPLIIGINYFQG